MAWWGRLRRRTAPPGRTARPGGPPERGGPDRGAPGGPVSSVPGDWDGGWRRTAPPELTVARAPLGVSDGLAFRAGLAAWRNPSFGTGLGHAVLPTAPAGLVRGVARPAAPRHAREGGGPLLLRAVRPREADGPWEGASEAGAADGPARPATAPAAPSSPAAPPLPSASAGSGREPAVARPGDGGDDGGDDGPAGKGGPADAPRPRGLTSTGSPAVFSPSPPRVQRAARPATGPVVAPADGGPRPAVPEIPLVRRVAVLPAAATDGSATRPAPGGSAPSEPAGRQTAATATAATAAVAEPRLTRGGRRPGTAVTAGSEASRPLVRARPVDSSPTVARRPVGPARRLPALPPAAAPAPGAGTPPDAPGAGSTAPGEARARSAAPGQHATARAASRAPLGAPLSGLPPTAVSLTEPGPTPAAAPTTSPAPGAGAAPGPALPVVQRRTDGAPDGAPDPSDGDAGGAAHDAPRRGPGAGRTGARTRGGLGAPLSALPPSAEPSGSLPSGDRASRTAHGPDLRHAPARRGRESAETAPPAVPPAVPPAPGGGGAGAPLLGTDGSRRGPADLSPTGDTAPSGPVSHRNGPATPLVTPAPSVVPHQPAPGGSVGTAGGEGPAGSARRPGAARGGPGSGSRRPPAAPGPAVVARTVAGPRPLTVTPSGSHSHTAPAAHRTLALLTARPLTLKTRVPQGAAEPSVSRPGGRTPVVAARWSDAPAASRDHSAPTAGKPVRSAGPRIQRAASVPVPPGPKASGSRGAGSSGPGRRVPVVRPAPPRGQTSGAAPAPAVPARSLPAAGPQTPAFADRPPTTPAPAPAPAGNIPVVRPRNAAPVPGPAPVRGPAAGGGTGRAAGPVQRTATGTGRAAVPAGVPAREVPARGRPRSASAPSAPPAPSAPSVSGRGTARPPEVPQDPGLDLDDLARRLLDPMARLLRTELRRGRERTGRPYDGRR